MTIVDRSVQEIANFFLYIIDNTICYMSESMHVYRLYKYIDSLSKIYVINSMYHPFCDLMALYMNIISIKVNCFVISNDIIYLRNNNEILGGELH